MVETGLLEAPPLVPFAPPDPLAESDSLIEPVRDRRPSPVVPSGTRSERAAWPWWIAAAACMVVVAVSAGVWMDARRTEREIPGLRQGMSLLRLEREVGVAVGRLGLASIRAAYDDPDFTDLPDERARVAGVLRGIEARLDTVTPLPAWASTVTRLQETLESGIRRMEQGAPPPEGLWAWQWAFTSAFSGIFPTDLTGGWSELLEYSVGTQYGVYVPVSVAELTLAHRARDEGGPAAHEGLRAYLEGEEARLEEVLEENEPGTSPFDPEFDVETATALGAELAFRVANVRSDPSVRSLEEVYRGVLAPDDDEEEVSPEALFDATAAALDVMAVAGEDLLRIVDDRLALAFVRARIRAGAAVVVGIAVAILGLGFLGWWMIVRGRLEGALRAAAERDALTGVNSRFSLFFHEESRLARPSARGVALLLTDMDDFKSINDRWGHTVGDGALREFARACTEVVGSSDRVARIGGDEFVIILHDREDPVESAAAVAEKLHANLAEPVDVEGVRLHLRATIGIAVAEGPMPIDELLLQADTALLDAKKTRRNRHAVYSRNYRRSLIREIDGALDSGAIEPVFQPIVRSSDLRLSGAELLARWTRDDGTQVPLDALIDAMVSVGASGVWTERMLLAAARVTPFLPNRDVRFWLNVAMPDLIGPGARTLIETLAGGPVPAARLGIEVTERILPADLPEARSTLLSLRASGLAIALDDVGSDGVPLRHLTELPLDRVKLDGPLVRDVDSCPAHRALLRGIVMSAADLGLEIVAEHVETEGEAQVLRELGVDFLQGYRTGAPVTIDTFIAAARREARPATV